MEWKISCGSTLGVWGLSLEVIPKVEESSIGSIKEGSWLQSPHKAQFLTINILKFGEINSIKTLESTHWSHW